jgi:hypothetical protein
MIGRRTLVIGFGPQFFPPYTTHEVENTTSVPVYVDRFILPAGLWDAFPEIEMAKVGRENFGRLPFSVMPDNPLAVAAPIPTCVRLRAGEKIILTFVIADAENS